MSPCGVAVKNGVNGVSRSSVDGGHVAALGSWRCNVFPTSPQDSVGSVFTVKTSRCHSIHSHYSQRLQSKLYLAAQTLHGSRESSRDIIIHHQQRPLLATYLTSIIEPASSLLRQPLRIILRRISSALATYASLRLSNPPITLPYLYTHLHDDRLTSASLPYRPSRTTDPR